MADFTKTVSNSLSIYGGERPNVWGTMTWGQNWGYGDTDLITEIGKYLSNSITLDSAITNIELGFFKTISNTISISVDMALERLTDTKNWSKVWGSSTNAESRPATSYNSTSNITTTYTPAAGVTTSWTEQ